MFSDASYVFYSVINMVCYFARINLSIQLSLRFFSCVKDNHNVSASSYGSPVDGIQNVLHITQLMQQPGVHISLSQVLHFL